MGSKQMNEIRTETTNKKTQFSRWNIVRKSAQTFDENPKIRVSGKEISLKEYQNNNAVDCNIYQVLEKYRGDLKMTAEQLNMHYTAINDELTNIKTLPDAMMQIKEGEKAWNSLPLETRAKFGYSVQNFIKNGPKFLQDEIKKYNDKIEKAKLLEEAANLKAQETTIIKGDVTNG